MFFLLSQWVNDFGKSFVVWVLLLGSCPVFCLVCCLLDETQIWPGDLRVVCGWFFVVFCLVGFAAAHMTTVLCADFYSTDASSHVRTEPSSDIGQTRKKRQTTSDGITMWSISLILLLKTR